MVGDTILIKDISINGNDELTGGLNTATSDQLSKTLTDNTINALGIDASSRTIWINGQPYGNAYVNIKGDNTVEAPIGAEIFNDFEHNIASGEYSHAEGRNTSATGNYSHAEGSETSATGDYSHAGGFYTKTTNTAEAAFGQFNQSTEGSTIFSIGDGDSDSSRHNIVEVTDNEVNINTNLNVEDNLIVDENATIEGTLGVTGKTTLSTLESTGNVDLESLDVTHNTTIGGTLGVTGKTTVSTLESAGNVDLESLDVTNNTTIGGTLDVTDKTTVSTLESTGNVDLESLDVTNNTTIGGTLGVTGNTTIGGTLGVTGKTTVSTLESTENAKLESLEVTNNTTIGGTLGVTGNTTIGGTLGVTGKTTVSTLESTENAKLESLEVTNNTTIGGTLGVTNDITSKGNIVGENNLRIIGETSLENKVAAGEGTFVQNDSEIAVGRFNKSNKNSDNYGNEGNTAFSIGIGESDSNRKNAVEVMQNGNVYINGVGEYNGTNPSDSSDLATYLPNMVNITYTDLKTLIDNDQLVPGQQYRITDYTCTTTTAGTKSAGHQFDIIVTADSKSVLNEEARAIRHDFTDDTSEDIKNHFANSDLNAWKIWYCLDNDTKRFAWADNSNNGRGVIYRMIDEWNNDVPCDFKNIIYVVPLSFIYNKNAYIYKFSRDTSIDMNINGTWYYGYITESTIPGWSENKCWVKEQNPNINSFLYKRNGIDTITDGNIIKVNLNTYETYTFGKDDSSLTGNCYNNIILPYYKSNILTLNNNTFDSGCYSNSFGNNCYNNSFGSNFRHNSFGNSCYCNSFGNGCDNNTFGNYCYNSVFEMTFHGNSFGNGCYSNYFDLGCNYNSFANNCICNSVGKNCTYNTFSNGCGDISIGNYCSYNFFGNGCSYIKFASDISEPSTKYNYYQNNHFGDRCKFILFTGSENSNSSSQVQNYNFAQGLQGKSGSKYLLVTGKRGRQYDTMVSMSRDYGNTVYGYCLADLANTVTHEVFNFS